MKELAGVIPPVVTPFTPSEEIDEDAMRAEVQHMVRAGVHGLTLTGSTGQGETLSIDETCRLATIAAEETGGSLPLVVGIIRSSTRDVIAYGKALKATGVVDALQVTPVHYLHPTSEAGTLGYYSDIGEQVELPMVIYNVIPWHTLSVNTMMKLADQTWVAAVKQSGGDFQGLVDLLAAVHKSGSDLRVLSGIDAALYSSYLIGAHGAVAAISSIVPKQSVALWVAVQAGDLERAQMIHERVLPVRRAIEATGFDKPALVKASIEVQGRKVGIPRRPQLPASEKMRASLLKLVEESGELD